VITKKGREAPKLDVVEDDDVIEESVVKPVLKKVTKHKSSYGTNADF